MEVQHDNSSDSETEVSVNLSSDKENTDSQLSDFSIDDDDHDCSETHEILTETWKKIPPNTSLKT